jgi:protein O-mannosyl-transferase
MSKKSPARAATSAKASASSCTLLSTGPATFLLRQGTLLASGIIVLVALIAYHNSFFGPFILDDSLAITDNPSIRHWGSILSPPAAATTGGRPLLNLTFALNYALGGIDVRGYHAFNLLVHVLAGLTLFGILRRTFLRPALNSRFGVEAVPLALAMAVIWVVHPLQTESVTYISQRAESLMGLFYLLTLYCFICSAQSVTPARWQILSVAACLLGVMSKEIIATAPVMVLLYDRTFVAGSFREAWRQRWRYYLGLAGTWLVLARLMAGLSQRGVGFDQGVTWWSYALTSCRSVVLYFNLAFWPHPLVFDYGFNIVHNATTILPCVLVVVVFVAVLVVALRWRPVIGFACAWFFLILAPTSSVVPVALQPMAEHRVYLSLVAIIALVVLGLHALIGRRSMMVFAAAAAGLCWLTIQRNRDYRSDLAIWSDTVAKCTESARAHYNLGTILLQFPGRLSDAIAQFETALSIKSDYAQAHGNLGLALSQIPGKSADAIAEYQSALRIKPDFAEAHSNLGNALLRIPGRLPDAIAEFETALLIKPDFAEAHNNLGNALSQTPGRLPDAIAEFETALRINPNYAEAHNNLGNALSQTPGQLPEAIAEYQSALRINPNYAEAHNSLGSALSQIPDRLPDAIVEYQSAFRIKPDYAEAHYNMGHALLEQGRYPAACEQYEEALKVKHDFAEGHLNLGVTFFKMGRLSDAIAQFQTALQIRPGYLAAQKNLEMAQYLLFNNRGENSSEHSAP